MRDWTKSIYSDGTEGYVSNPSPVLGEEITVPAFGAYIIKLD